MDEGSGLIEYVGEERLVFDHPDLRMEKADLNRIFANYDSIGAILYGGENSGWERTPWLSFRDTYQILSLELSREEIRYPVQLTEVNLSAPRSPEKLLVF
ncbi:hypothetical protein DCC85_15265 [Paenibacillus sp. CAA11]|uniref:hypothetical protein n=1 Tax=Paenibacillus sp. CAA11 TaxID=1532905 RepID=UPI000D334112|nr:hypothetical protein [Paenibacillus sp. CAA11]AWB45445.1 hypothetical protein DCC85_15265 [Paenibacillus sp. CAA11]